MNNDHQNNHPTDVDIDAATRRIAQLEATHAKLREAIVAKNSHIAMLEEKLLEMSVELASSRAREDEQNLMYRRSTQVDIMSSEDDGGNFVIPDGLVPKPVRNSKRRGRRRGSSRWSSASVSPCPDDQVVNSAAIDDDGIKSSPIQTTPPSSNNRRFSLKSSRGSSRNNLNESSRSLGSASSRAAEEQSSQPLPTTAEDFVPDQVVPLKTMRNNNSGRSNRRRFSDKDEDTAAVDYSTRSAPVRMGGLLRRHNTCSNLDDSTKSFSVSEPMGLFSSRRNSMNLDDSMKSFTFSPRSSSLLSSLQSSFSAAVADKQQDELSVDFPESRRPTYIDVNEPTRASRIVSIRSAFRKSETTEATTACTSSTVVVDDFNLSSSSRSFLSCVVFPRDEEDVLLGCE